MVLWSNPWLCPSPQPLPQLSQVVPGAQHSKTPACGGLCCCAERERWSFLGFVHLRFCSSVREAKTYVFHPFSGTRILFNAKNMIAVVFFKKYHSLREYIMTKTTTNLVVVGILN